MGQVQPAVNPDGVWKVESKSFPLKAIWEQLVPVAETTSTRSTWLVKVTGLATEKSKLVTWFPPPAWASMVEVPSWTNPLPSALAYPMTAVTLQAAPGSFQIFRV